MESSTGMSSGWMTCPLRKRAPLNSPGMIWVISWQSTCPAASSVRISFILSSPYRVGIWAMIQSASGWISSSPKSAGPFELLPDETYNLQHRDFDFVSRNAGPLFVLGEQVIHPTQVSTSVDYGVYLQFLARRGRTRSPASFTQEDRYPTIFITGSPSCISVSTDMSVPSIPCTSPLNTLLYISKCSFPLCRAASPPEHILH